MVFSNLHVLFGCPQLLYHGPPLLYPKVDAVNDDFEDCASIPPDSPSPIIELEGPHSNEVPDGGFILEDNDDGGIAEGSNELLDGDNDGCIIEGSNDTEVVLVKYSAEGAECSAGGAETCPDEGIYDDKEGIMLSNSFEQEQMNFLLRLDLNQKRKRI